MHGESNEMLMEKENQRTNETERGRERVSEIEIENEKYAWKLKKRTEMV